GIAAGGRAVVLVGRKNLGTSTEAATVVDHVLAALAAGNVPSGVLPIIYQPCASAAIAAIVSAGGDGDEAGEILLDGPRGSGKTQAIPGALAILAELHWRSRHTLPLRALWLHDQQVNASMKTGRSLELPMWGGLWRLQDDRRQAVFTVGGREMIHADFVGTRDESSAERLRAECHVLAAEEIVPSL